MVNICIDFCFVISWIAVPTLALFSWIAFEEPLLLEIEKEYVKEGREVLVSSTLVYLIIAVLMTILRNVKAKKSKMMLEDPNLSIDGYAKVNESRDSINLEDVVQRNKNAKSLNESSLTGSFDNQLL